ncbi:Protein of unknown function [Pyronema omphalodes CBS 100304]|uniref:Uncharacterized protein n=1 Tax=Pyronema omphalodes (strain CBS 100304) TaxID=1076935 RepID=U4LKL3_PYROM|nr:Protein of unknown function [Pyronema omphalodes CBS 100304]
MRQKTLYGGFRYAGWRADTSYGLLSSDGTFFLVRRDSLVPNITYFIRIPLGVHEVCNSNVSF